MLRSNIKVSFKEKMAVASATVLLILSVGSIAHLILNIARVLIGD